MKSPRLDSESLLREASQKTGLSDLGDDSFLERFQVLLRDAEAPGVLHFVGRIAIRRQLVSLLSNRLQIRKWLKDRPETRDIPLNRPMFVVGQARTGTTLVYNLLAQDPHSRAPLLWELARPVPPPDPGSRSSDPRIREIESQLKSALSIIPSIMTAHAIDPRGPEECYHLLENSAFSSTFLLYFEIPSYWKRLMAASQEEARRCYREFREQIQILQTLAQGARWVSKSPAHLFFLEALLEAFPDAAIVYTHRDPLESIPSLSSLIAIVRGFASDQVDPQAIGQSTLGWYLEAFRRAEEARARVDAGRIFDLSYGALVRDPVGSVRELYARVGLPFTPDFEGRLRTWMAQNPQHKHGVHRYSLEQFGLDRDQVLRATQDYRMKYLGG